MRGEWRVASLGESGVTLIDCDHRTPPAASTGYPYVAIPQLKAGRIDLSDVRRISGEHFVEWTRKANPQPFDVVLSRRCNPGETAFVAPDLKFALGQNLVLLRANGTKILPEFLRWLVRGPYWWEQVQKFLNVGAVFDSLRCADVPKFELPVPPLPEQRAIARILGALDDKIELNRKMNETLEAMARALFKSWFVDFDPVRAKAEGRAPTGMDAETAKLFPSEFVDSELGPIPKGWQIGNIANVASNRRDTVHPKDVQPGIVYVGLEHLPRARLFFEETGTPDDLESLKVQFSAGEVLFGKLRPYFKKVAVAPCEGIGSTEILVLSPRPNANAFVALLAASDPLIEHAVALSDGTRMPRTSWEQLTRFLIAVPPEPILRAFNEHCIAFFRRAEAARRESIMLARLRDELLPRLLSGEVSVAHAEREVGAVA